MLHTERITAVLRGEPVDRIPVSVWGHDFLREWSARDLAAQTVERYRAHDYDFVKINPRWTLFAEPWGNRYVPPTEQKFPELLERVVQRVEDLARVSRVSAVAEPFAEHVEAVARITDEIGDEVDCIATLFSPLAVLGLLAGGIGRPLTRYLPEGEGVMLDALSHITKTLIEHARDLLDAGASGIFYAPLQWTSTEFCSEEIYASLGEPHDRRLLAEITDARFNMLHVCGNHVVMERFLDYPAAVLNWDNFGPGNPTLSEVARNCDKVVAGGIPHKALHRMDLEALTSEARTALDGLDRGVMLAGGCGIGAQVPEAPRNAVVAVAESLSRPV